MCGCGEREATMATAVARRHIVRRDYESKYLLTGFVRCATCGGSITVVSRSHRRKLLASANELNDQGGAIVLELGHIVTALAAVRAVSRDGLSLKDRGARDCIEVAGLRRSRP